MYKYHSLKDKKICKTSSNCVYFICKLISIFTFLMTQTYKYYLIYPSQISMIFTKLIKQLPSSLNLLANSQSQLF